ncbi:Ubiquitin fusion degradation protein 4, partial [Teratosphaeriaceae sp. CCFEE 6253]
MKTRAATARQLQQADTAPPPPPPAPTTGATPPVTASRKRKAAPSPPSASSRKRSKSKPTEPESSQPTAEGRRRSARTSAATEMSETSPEQTSAEGSRHRGSRKKSSKEEGSSSRKSKKGARKDQDVTMTDGDEKADATGDADDAGAGAAESSEAMMRRAEEQLDEMERNADPFGGGYLGRFGGHAGLSSSLRALSGIMSGTSSRLRNDLEQLRMKEDPSVQLIALQDLSELLLVSNEDNLAGHFAPDQYVKELVTLMQPNEFTGEENPEIMLMACRCIANMMEALPASTASVVYGGAVPILCQKLLEIHFIDLAEQALSTLEKISVEFPSSIVREGGLTACLTYLDFFATSTQRTAVTTAANCCRNIPEDSFPTVRDVMPILLTTLTSGDQRVVEQASLCVSRIVDSFKYKEDKLEELISTDLLKAILRLLLPGSTNMIGPNIHTQFLRVLSITARASSRLSVDLLRMNVVDTLYQILTGVSAPSTTHDAAKNIDKNIIMQAIIRTPRDQIFETLNVICELLPTISRDNLTFLDELYDAGNPLTDRVSMSARAKATPNDKKLELLRECPAEVKRFAVILFPTLMHAFTSTVNLSVRQKVLTAQLKMLSNFDTEILEEALLGVSYASHLASILTQQENASLVTFALQAAELLLKRMESIYRPQFYREGVMAEVTKLAERSMKSASPVDSPSALAELAEQPPPPVDEDDDEDTDQEDGEPATIEVDMNPALGNEDEMHDDEDDNDNENENDDENEDHGIDGGDGEGEANDDGSDDSEPPPADKPRPVTDVQDIITLRAKRFMDAHSNEGTPEMREKASRVLDDLRGLASELKACYSGIDNQGGTELFQRLAKYFDGDALQSVTSYELMTSGIVDVLLALFSDPDEQAATEARSDFLEVFMSTANISKAVTGNAASPATPFSVFVMKLQDLLSRAEHFEVITVERNSWENGGRSAASMLAKQLRLKLVADDDSGIPRHFRNIMVSIHAIATFKALDDYLRPRISMAERPPRSRREGVSSAMAAYTAIMAGREGRGVPPPALPTLGSSLPTRSASKKSSRSKSTKSEPATDESGASRLRRSSRRHASQPTSTSAQDLPPPPPPADPEGQSQDPLECADEAQLEDDDDDEDMQADLEALVDDLEEGGLEEEAAEPTAVNMEVANSGKVTARTEDGDRVNTPSQGAGTPTARDRMSASARLALAREMLSTPTSSSRPMSFAQALQSTPQDWHLEFSINDQPITSDITIYRACHFNQAQGDEVSMRTIWSNTHTIKFKKVQGPPPTESSSTSPAPDSLSHENGLPPSLDKNPITSGILRLMSILHDLNANLDDVLAENMNAVKLNTEPLTQFVNAKLTAKLNRQLEEPLIVASLCLPSWSEDLARLYPFLFPFETRHLFLQSTSFGYARSMSRWQGAQSE